MHCPTCGQWESDTEARFCGQCGATLEVLIAEVVEPNESLEELLSRLAKLVEDQPQVPREVAKQIRSCAAAMHGNHSRVVVMGQHRRGKSTVVNRLLGQAVAPTTNRQQRVALHVRQLAQSKTDDRLSSKSAENPTSFPHQHTTAQPGPDSHAKPVANDLADARIDSTKLEPFSHQPIDTASHSRSELNRSATSILPVDGSRVTYHDADILKHAELIDTPFIEEPEQLHTGESLQHALLATAIIFCIDARQILSVGEREVLRQIILPFTSCPILLAVTFLDQVPDPLDQAELQELLSRHLQRLGSNRLELMMLAPGHKPTDRLLELERWIEKQVGTQPAPPITPGQLLELFTTIEALLLPESDRQADNVAARSEQALAILAREHKLAMRQTTALIRETLSHLRGDLKAIMVAVPETSRGFDGLDHVVRQVRSIMEDCGRHYLTILQAALHYDGPAALRATSQSIDKTVPLHLASPAEAAPEFLYTSRRNWQASGLEAAAVTAALLMSGWVAWLGAGVTLIAVNHWRTSQRERREMQSAIDSVIVLQQWLNDVEPNLIRTFEHAAETVHQELRQSVLRRFEPLRGQEAPAREADPLRHLIARCRQLLSQRYFKSC